MSAQQILTGYPWRPILVSAADFDGTNDYMTRGAGLTGAADSKSGILSVWLRFDGGNATLTGLFNLVTTLGGGTGRCNFIKSAANLIQVFGSNSAGSVILLLTSNSTYTASATWLHVLASWDLAAAAGHLYINGANDLAAGPTLTNDTIDYTVADSGIGALPDGTAKFNGCMTELYFAPGQFLDFSTASNVLKFRTSTGVPMYLGTDGSLPTGSAPIVYQRIAAGAAVTTFATNKGGGGDYTITGTLDAGSSSPSD